MLDTPPLSRLKHSLRRTAAYDWLRASRAQRQLAQWTPQDELMRGFYAGLMQPGELCFDVGANIGNRVKVFLRCGARVVAVEPQRRCARILRRAFRRAPAFTLVEKAVGAEPGRAEIRLGDADILSSLSPE